MCVSSVLATGVLYNGPTQSDSSKQNHTKLSKILSNL